MTLGAAAAFVLIFGLPLWLVIEELAHRTRSWRTAPERREPTLERGGDAAPRRAL